MPLPTCGHPHLEAPPSWPSCPKPASSWHPTSPPRSPGRAALRPPTPQPLTMLALRPGRPGGLPAQLGPRSLRFGPAAHRPPPCPSSSRPASAVTLSRCLPARGPRDRPRPHCPGAPRSGLCGRRPPPHRCVLGLSVVGRGGSPQAYRAPRFPHLLDPWVMGLRKRAPDTPVLAQGHRT